MNPEYAFGHIRIHFESRARRRWLVALFYALMAALFFAPFSAHPNALTVWIVSGYGILLAALFIVFTGVAGDPYYRGDEREAHRRDHAHFLAYRILLFGFLAVFFCYFAAIPFARFFMEPNSSSLFLPVELTGSFKQHFLIAPICIFIGSLPQAILLWTEPDMETEA
jgi:Ca2+/Na+ antiporter